MLACKPISVTNLTRSSTVCSAGYMADTFLSRLVGLLGTSSLPADSCLFLNASLGVHTFGMKYPIDIVALDRERRILGIWEQVPPRKVRAVGLKTSSILELQAGVARQCGLLVGDRLRVKPVHAAADAAPRS